MTDEHSTPNEGGEEVEQDAPAPAPGIRSGEVTPARPSEDQAAEPGSDDTGGDE